MDVRIAELSRTVDPAVLGNRIRSARVAAGLTQAEVAAGLASTAYISRIEAGQRRPELRLLDRLAERLRTSTEDLVSGLPRNRTAELQLSLDYAELALASGNAQDALTRAREALRDLEGSTAHTLRRSAQHVLAAALEAVGEADEAILLLEELVADEPRDATWIKSLIALSRLYRYAGDYSRAINVGERGAEAVRESGLESTGEAIQLTLTVAAAYFERGEAGHAARMCQRALRQAEKLESPLAIASAYWNASVIESRRGQTEAAIPLAEKALGYFESGEDARNLARLRSQLGSYHLRLDPPQPEQAKLALVQAARDLDCWSATPIDRAENDLALARAHLLLGEREEAGRLARASLDQVVGIAPLHAAEALVLQGEVAAEAGELTEARAKYREAIHVLSAAGADRRAGELWFELANLFDELGAHDEARMAYRSAAATAGLSVGTSRRSLESAMAIDLDAQAES